MNYPRMEKVYMDLLDLYNPSTIEYLFENDDRFCTEIGNTMIKHGYGQESILEAPENILWDIHQIIRERKIKKIMRKL